MKILAISAHPDDETLGCCGALLKHKAAADTLFWVIATKPYEPRWSSDVIKNKAVEVQRVAQTYQMKDCFNLDFPAAQLDSTPQSEIIEALRKVFARVKPELVYLVHGGDVHTDHQVVFAAVISVLKPFYMAQYGVRRVLSYETLSSTDAAPLHVNRPFLPNVYCDITPYIDRKIKMMELYESEAQVDPLPRGSSAIRALARYRGATIGIEYAEAFMLVRELV